MASSLLDELPCLLDEADELVARLGFFLKLLFSPPPSRRVHPTDQTTDPFVLRQQLAGVDVEAIARSFSKHLLLVPTATGSANTALTDKLDALLPPPDSVQRTALQTLIAKIFHLMKRVYQWQQTAWDDALLPLFVDANASRLAFDSHRALTTLVLNGVAKSVKLHLLWSSYANLSGLLVLHTFLEGKKTAHAPTKDQDLHRALDFVLYFGSNPLIKLQQDLQQHPLAQAIASSLVELVLSCFDCYVGAHDLARLKHGGVLFEVDAAVVQGGYASSPLFHDLLLLPQLVEWVLCVALCLPQQWKAAPLRNTSWQLWDFVQLVAQERLVIVVARDVVVNIHDLLFQQLSSALASSSSSHSSSSSDALPPLQPLKKALTRLSKRTVQSAGERRRERRVFVLWFLRDCVKLLRHNGALAAPLFPRALAVLALARDEIEWLLAHGTCFDGLRSSGSYQSSVSKLLPNHVKSKHWDRAAKSYAMDAGAFTELLGLFHELHALLQRERDCVGRYYMQFIARGDADAIATEIRTFLPSAKDDEAAGASGSAPNDQLAVLLLGFADRRRFQLAPSDPGFASWRREWQQLSVHLLMNGEDSVSTAVRGLLDRACRHANYVQAFDLLLDRAGSRSKCFWFRDVLDRCLRDLVKRRAVGSTDTDSSNVWVVTVVLSSLAAGETAIDELLEASEATHERACLLDRIELQNRVIGETLQRLIDELVAQEERLHAKLSPLLVIERMGPKRVFKHGVSSSSKTAMKAATTMLLLTPGTESRLLATPDAAVETALPLASARTRLTSIVACLNHLATTLSANEPTLLSLTELVKSSIQACLVRFLRGLVPDSTPGDSSRGLMLRVSWEDAARQWRALVRSLQLQFQSLRRYVNVTQLVETVRVAECTVDETMGAGAAPARLLDRVLAFYASMLETKCTPKPKSHSHSNVTLLACFSKSSYVLNPQLSVAPGSLEAAAYASPTAVAFLQEIVGMAGVRRLRDLAVKYVATHTTALFGRLEKDKIALIRLKLAFPDDQSEMHMAVRIMDALDSGIVQEMLCVGNGVFFLQLLDQSSRLAGADAVGIQEATTAWRGVLWTQWGVDSDNDSTLPSHVQAIWNLLPWAFVGVFHGSVWTKTSYLSELDATTTNVHLLAVAMQFLVDTFEPRSPQEKDKQDDEHAAGDELQRRRERRRHVAYVASQAVLSLRREAVELPTLAMVVVAKQLTRSLGVCCGASEEGSTQHWLPDFLEERTPRAA